jgi:hypothetical protein
MNISTNTNNIHRAAGVLLTMGITATAVGLAATSCADEGPASQLQPLMPTPANTQLTDGPAGIPHDGIHMHFWVNGSAPDVLAAYKTALEHKGWAVTVVSSEGWKDAGSATYTATRGTTYGVFSGGGNGNRTDLQACAWPSKPANPNCGGGNRG